MNEMEKFIFTAIFTVGFMTIGYGLRGLVERYKREREALLARYTEAEKLAMRNYSVTVYQEQLSDGSVYIAETIELPYCRGMGRTQWQAEKDLRDARVDYIAHMLKYNLPVPEPKGKTK